MLLLREIKQSHSHAVVAEVTPPVVLRCRCLVLVLVLILFAVQGRREPRIGDTAWAAEEEETATASTVARRGDASLRRRSGLRLPRLLLVVGVVDRRRGEGDRLEGGRLRLLEALLS